MNNRLIHTLEVVWLIIALLSFISGIYNLIYSGVQESLMFFLITFISLIMYLFRRRLRKSQKP